MSILCKFFFVLLMSGWLRVCSQPTVSLKLKVKSDLVLDVV
uniref:Uncharacterized protein n=1 Tax=Phakopsora pachyrhizi TaxID=170000 RepID=A0A0S1MJJ3_PHAPC